MLMMRCIFALAIALSAVLTVFPLCKILADIMRGRLSMARYCTDNVFMQIVGIVMLVTASVFVLNGYVERRNEYLYYVHHGVETEGVVIEVRKERKEARRGSDIDRNHNKIIFPNAQEPNNNDSKSYTYKHMVKYAGKNGESIVSFERGMEYAIGDKVRVVYLNHEPEEAIVLDLSNGVIYHTLLLIMGLAFASLAVDLFLLSCMKFAVKRRKLMKSA